MKALKLLMAGVAGFGIAAPAAAQDMQVPQPATADTGGLDDIVVTATRREESLQRVPIAITALSGDRLAQ